MNSIHKFICHSGKILYFNAGKNKSYDVNGPKDVEGIYYWIEIRIIGFGIDINWTRYEDATLNKHWFGSIFSDYEYRRFKEWIRYKLIRK